MRVGIRIHDESRRRDGTVRVKPASAAPEPWNLPAGFRGGDGTDRLVCANGRLSLELWTEYAYDLDARMFMA